MTMLMCHAARPSKLDSSGCVSPVDCMWITSKDKDYMQGVCAFLQSFDSLLCAFKRVAADALGKVPLESDSFQSDTPSILSWIRTSLNRNATCSPLFVSILGQFRFSFCGAPLLQQI